MPRTARLHYVVLAAMAPRLQRPYAIVMEVMLWIHPACGPALEAEISGLDVRRAYDASPETGLPGRGTVRTIVVLGQRMLLKRERRGGFSRYFMPDRYFRREPFIRELNLSLLLETQGLAPPLLARWFLVAAGLAEIYTLLQPLEEAVSLMELLRAGKQTVSHFKAAGDLVGRLHALGVHHGDLNAGNILLDKRNKAWGIDWRHSYLFVPPPDGMRLSNLRRLQRSIVKAVACKGAGPGKDFWAALAAGYREGGDFGDDTVTKSWLRLAGRKLVLRRFFWGRRDARA